MTVAALVQPSNIVAIQQAVMNIIQSAAPTYVFKTTGFDRVPPPQELSITTTGASKLPAAFVLTPTKAHELREANLREIDWEIDVCLIWAYKGKTATDNLLKNALAYFEDLFAANFDLQSTCSPRAQIKNTQAVDWSPKDKPTNVQWKTVTFTVFAHEDLDFQWLPPL